MYIRVNFKNTIYVSKYEIPAEVSKYLRNFQVLLLFLFIYVYVFILFNVLF